MWALPTPTTFEKVDQTFIIAWINCALNHNLSQFLTNKLSKANKNSPAAKQGSFYIKFSFFL
ncbi:MAG TPA: hypothetical protein DHV76_03540 [Ruminococcaceae bacterium]|nr:hypothetical protein [Oscillospiraceae bacterium]